MSASFDPTLAPSPDSGHAGGETCVGHGVARGYWPMVFLVVIVISGMAFSLLWNPLFYHSPFWITPGDLWNTYREAQYVTWGGEGQLYNNPAYFQTLPGIAIVLAPVAWLADALHLSESFSVTLARPTSWWLLGPVQLGLAATLLFPLDKLARLWHIPSRRRIVLLAVESALIWPSVVFWGHPEDALSVTLALYGLLAVVDQRWLRFATLFGLATLMQPLVLLALPVCLVYVARRHWVATLAVIGLPALLALLAPLLQEWGPTWQRLTHQPNFFRHNHPTPWAALSPVITPDRVVLVHSLTSRRLASGQWRFIEVTTRVHTLPVVSAGPGRILALVAACCCGLIAARYARTLTHIVWFAALALALRCVFEPVMVPYYLLPALALAVLAASTRPRHVFGIVVLGAGLSWYVSSRHLGEWTYYLTLMSVLLVTLVVARPNGVFSRPSPSVATIRARTLDEDAAKATSLGAPPPGDGRAAQ